MSEHSENMFGQQPEIDIAPPKDPDFITKKGEPSTFEDTQADWELHKQVLDSVKEMSDSAAKTEHPIEEPVKAHHFKIGDLDVDEYPTGEITPASVGRVLTAQEMAHIESDPRYKNMSDREKILTIRKYIKTKDSLS